MHLPVVQGIVDSAEFAQLRKEMEEYDDMRENVIKQCRDMQKGSKNSIYQLHRYILLSARHNTAVHTSRTGPLCTEWLATSLLVHAGYLLLSTTLSCSLDPAPCRMCRGDIAKAKGELEKVKLLAQALLPVVTQQETLRGGSFSNAMEEYAEGVLFQLFLEDGRVGSLEDVAPANAVEYVGGLLDLTGEVGRYAVKEATKRNVSEVQKCQVPPCPACGRP